MVQGCLKDEVVRIAIQNIVIIEKVGSNEFNELLVKIQFIVKLIDNWTWEYMQQQEKEDGWKNHFSPRVVHVTRDLIRIGFDLLIKVRVER